MSHTPADIVKMNQQFEVARFVMSKLISEGEFDDTFIYSIVNDSSYQYLEFQAGLGDEVLENFIKAFGKLKNTKDAVKREQLVRKSIAYLGEFIGRLTMTIAVLSVT